MKLRAIKTEQLGRSIYISSMEANEFNDEKLVSIDEWNPDLKEDKQKPEDFIEKQGYQQTPPYGQYEKLSRYLTEDDNAMLPTSILLSCRSKLRFEETEPGSGVGYLSINSKDMPLYVLDGQKRIYALRHLTEEEGPWPELGVLLDFDIPVNIIDNISKIEEIRYFHVINSTQKKADTTLAERLMAIMAEKEAASSKYGASKKGWKIRATRIAEILADDPESPWYQRIKKTNEKTRRDRVATEKTFILSLGPIIRNVFLQDHSDEELAEWIKLCWIALKELMPEAFAEPRKYVIQKTTGMNSLNMVFQQLLLECYMSGELTRDYIKSVLNRLEDYPYLDPDFWLSGGIGAAKYIGNHGFKLLRDEMIRAIFVDHEESKREKEFGLGEDSRPSEDSD